jgi:hypothetical protein
MARQCYRLPAPQRRKRDEALARIDYEAGLTVDAGLATSNYAVHSLPACCTINLISSGGDCSL